MYCCSPAAESPTVGGERKIISERVRQKETKKKKNSDISSSIKLFLREQVRKYSDQEYERLNVAEAKIHATKYFREFSPMIDTLEVFHLSGLPPTASRENVDMSEFFTRQTNKRGQFVQIMRQ